MYTSRKPWMKRQDIHFSSKSRLRVEVCDIFQFKIRHSRVHCSKVRVIVFAYGINSCEGGLEGGFLKKGAFFTMGRNP